MPKELENFENFLRCHDLKHSKPRNDTVEGFHTCSAHFSAQELNDQVRHKSPRGGFVTVYRTLKLWEGCSLGRSVDYADGTQR